jgi:hypothetical protein
MPEYTGGIAQGSQPMPAGEALTRSQGTPIVLPRSPLTSEVVEVVDATRTTGSLGAVTGSVPIPVLEAESSRPRRDGATTGSHNAIVIPS